ncbi:MAG: hypothetical protein II736_00895, partial [Clostridia bacterium]|nr:hypothetical protein [Clostridia bacterium]
LIAALMLVALAAPSFGFKYDDPALDDLNGRLTEFSAKMYSQMAEGENEDKNFTVSPVSIYFAFAMLHYSGDAEVKKEIENYTGMTAGDFEAAAELFEWLDRTYPDENGNTAARLSLSNSVWTDDAKAYAYDREEIEKMCEKLLASAEEAPFFEDNPAANEKIREFIKEKTNGLIDQNFELPRDVVFALINTLYFKDNWDIDGDDLRTVSKYFNADGGIKEGDFVLGLYRNGRVDETESSYFFSATTFHGYQLKFILPKDGYTLADAMSPENLTEINGREDLPYIDENGTHHYTRCVFPEFKTESDTDLLKLFKKTGAFPHTLSGYGSALLSDEADFDLALSGAKHVAKLNVDKKGVEGAAVTIFYSEATSVGGPEPDKQYHDFVLNRNFGYLVTDREDVILFAGQVKDPYEDGQPIPEDELPAGIEERFDGTFAVDIPNDESYKADGVAGVRFTVKPGIESYDKNLYSVIAVEGAAEGTTEITDNGDGTFTVVVRDTDLIASVPAGEPLVKVILGYALNENEAHTAKEVLDAFRVISAEIIPAEEEQKDDPVEKEDENKGVKKDDVVTAPRTSDPTLILAAVTLAGACGMILMRKKLK